MTLSDYLIENSEITTKEVEITLGSRFKDKEGKLLKFKIKPVSGDEFSAYQKKASKIEFAGKKRVATMDSAIFNNLIIVNHCVEPNFRDANLLKGLGVQTPEQAIQKVLLAGEIVDLASKISDISGFESDINDEIENAKN